MNAIILAGGFGTRLMPFTASMPKPSLNVANMPMIDYPVSMLSFFGIKEISFALAHMPEKIIEWTAGYKYISCHYNVESIPLGTCGAVKAAQDYLDDEFFVLSGDGLCDIDLFKMIDRHKKSKAEITMAVTNVKDPTLYGVVDIDDCGYIKSFFEKPKTKVSGAYINCGAYIVNKSVLNCVPSDSFYDFSKDLFPLMLRSDRKIATYVHNGYWNDVGSLESYHKSNMEILKGGAFFDFEYNRFRKHLIGSRINGSLIANSATVDGSVKSSVIGNNCVIRKDAALKDCVVLENSYVSGSYENCIIDKKNIISVDGISDKTNIISPSNMRKDSDGIIFKSH